MSYVNYRAPLGRKERAAIQRHQIDEFYDSVKQLRQKSRLDYNERRIHEFERFVLDTVVIYRILVLNKSTSNHTVASFHRLNVAYNNILRRLLRRPRFCSASGLFVECRIPNCKAVIRNLIFRFMTRLDLSKNSIIFTILGSDIRWTSRIRRHWVKSLYVHHNLVWLLLSYLCYYHFYVLHDKIDCLVLTFCISMCMDRHMYAVLILCVWNKHLSIYLSLHTPCSYD